VQTLGKVVLEQEETFVQTRLLRRNICEFSEEIAVGSQVVPHEASMKTQGIGGGV
jgi:hypothetical protein